MGDGVFEGQHIGRWIEEIHAGRVGIWTDKQPKSIVMPYKKDQPLGAGAAVGHS